MIDYREILRLNSLKYSQRQIAASVHSSRNTISEVLKLADQNNLSWPLDDQLTNEKVCSMLYPDRITAVNPRKEPDYNYIHKELAKQGVNLTLLWTEYCSDCRASENTPYMYSQFCEKYRKWARLTKATMRISHKPGDAMQVDWAGTTIPYYDRVTGEVSTAYLFAAVLPCSCYAYVEACDDMKITNWLLCHVHAYQYFGGVTRLLIPDNLKTGVTKNTRYETVLNRSYAEMAEYYETAVVPARVRAPQDKSTAEGTVRFATTWIIAALRNQKFFSLEEINQAVKEKLDELNKTPFKKREGCRFSAYISEEKEFMKPLPLIPFEPAVWSTAKVPFDYLITDGKNKYSVPFDLIGERVDIRLTKTTVEVFFHGSRVASHPRCLVARRDPVIQPEHMPQEHRKYLSYNADDFTVWAMSIGEDTAKVVEIFLTSGNEPEQGYKACASLTKLADRYGHERLECACRKTLELTARPSIRILSSMLKNGQDKVGTTDQTKTTSTVKTHGITRGASYFAKGGDDK